MRTQWIVAGLVTAALGLGGLSLAGCTSTTTAGTSVDTTAESKVESIPGTSVKRITLTEHAATRLGIETTTVGGTAAVSATATVAASAPGAAGGVPGPSAVPGTVVPYSAVLYDADGGTWVYTVPQAFTYQRAEVTVEVVQGVNGDEAVLSKAPPVGTVIVTIGVVELYGTELGIGEVIE
jgi:hypothetical protein